MPVDRPLPRGDRTKADDPLPANQGGKAPIPAVDEHIEIAHKLTLTTLALNGDMAGVADIIT
jgi:hypothetical protein